MAKAGSGDATGADVLVIGAGIAGASLACFLAPHRHTLLLERESQPGYHSTGRSAAQYIATYGTPQVRALTLASRAFFDQPPPGFAEHPLLRPRPVMTVGLHGQEAALDEAWQVLRAVTDTGRRLTPAQACEAVPVLREAALVGALWEPESFDMDVHALHQGFLRRARQAGAGLVTDAEALSIDRRGERWRVTTPAGVFEAPVLVNAAGAWCDVVARRAGVSPLGLQPRRRSALMLRGPEGLDFAAWPLVADAVHSFYFKPDAGALLASPANEDDTEPQDVQPEELDIARAIDRLEHATTLALRPTRRWAGLRSFVPDGDLVAGFDAQAPGFFWCAGQGGYGIQTSPAMGMAGAALVCGEPLTSDLRGTGLTPLALSPARPSLSQAPADRP